MSSDEGPAFDELTPETGQEMLRNQLRQARNRSRTSWRTIFLSLAAALTLFAVGLAFGVRMPREAADFLALFIVCLLVVPLLGYLLVRLYLSGQSEE